MSEDQTKTKSQPKQRRKPKKAPKPVVDQSTLPVPEPRTLIDVSLKIIQAEIGKLSTVSASGQLDPQQARILTEYVKTLVVVDKNAKELPEDDDVSDLSDEELLVAAKEAIQVVKQKSGDKK